MPSAFVACLLLALLAAGCYGVLRAIPYQFSDTDRRRWAIACTGSTLFGAAMLGVARAVGADPSLATALLWCSPAIVLLLGGLVLHLLIPTPAFDVSRTRGPRRFEAELRIGIVGAGPAGLAVAEELRSLGYQNLTILEARPDAGGKVSTREAGGVSYEAGQVWTVPSARMRKYFVRYGIPDTLRALPGMLFVSRDGRQRQNPWIMSSPVRGRLSPMRWVEFVRYLLATRRHSRLDNIGFRDAIYDDPAMAESSHQWFAARGLGFMEQALGPLMQVTAAGHHIGTMPFGHVVKVLGVFSRFSFFQILTLALPGVHFRENGQARGNQAVWQRMAASHAGLRLGEPVDRIERGETVRVTTRRATYEFDQLIWAAPMTAYPRIVQDASAEEIALFSTVQSYKRAVIVARVEGLPTGILWLYRTTEQDGLPASHPRVMYETETGSRIFKFFPGFGEGDTAKDLSNRIVELVRAHGATNVEILDVNVWDYYPHHSREAVLAGAWRRQEALQGQHRTWFVGELFAGASIPLAVEYSADLVHRHF